MKTIKHAVSLLFLLFFIFGKAQETKKIHFEGGGTFLIDQQKYPGAQIFSKDGQQLRFIHQGADLWCDLAVLYNKENHIKAFGNVFLQQGDSLQLHSDYLEYNGNTRVAMARDHVTLTNPDMTLTSDTLYLDRAKQEAYYNSPGTIKDTTNVLTSNKGRYYIAQKRYQFLDNVTITNPEYNVKSAELDYYTDSKHAYMYGPSTITGKAYKIYCERGFYDTQTEQGYFVKKSKIHYNDRIIKGDSLYFNQKRSFASASNHIKIIDTINKGVLKAHYAEVYKKKDSVFATKKAVAITAMEKDSLYIHADTLMVTGKPKNRIMRGFRKVKFYKTDLSGSCDSIHSSEKTGITKLIKAPILWYGKNQMTGDLMHLISNTKTNTLDSLKITSNAFLIEKDTIGTGYNQVKGKQLYGKFKENKLKTIDIVKNAQVVYYMYNDKQELIGIDKIICGSIGLVLDKNQIKDITFYRQTDGDLFPDEDLPKNARKLRGFLWRGKEAILNKDAIFDADDLSLKLPIIKGLQERVMVEPLIEQTKKQP